MRDEGRPINIAAVRQLLINAFTASDISRFLQDRPTFRPVTFNIGPGHGLSDMVDTVIDYCETRLLWPELLAEVKEVNPRQYARFEPRLFISTSGDTEQRPTVRKLTPAPGPTSLKPPGPIRNRWALLMGVNDFVDPAIPNLRYCVNDVLAMQDLLQKHGYTTIALHDNACHPYLIPTRDNLEAELVRLCSAAGPDDLLWIHLACHGQLVNGEPVLITQETREPTLSRKALPFSEVERQMRESRARRLVLTLDACHTGVETGRALTDPDFIRNAHQLAEGFVLLAASTAQQVAQEWQEEEHGVFTYFILDGLSGQADRAHKGFVTVDDLKLHVLDGLRRWRVQHAGLIQEPTARTEGMGDMVLVERSGDHV
jgi:hypothetical protein